VSERRSGQRVVPIRHLGQADSAKRFLLVRCFLRHRLKSRWIPLYHKRLLMGSSSGKTILRQDVLLLVLVLVMDGKLHTNGQQWTGFQDMHSMPQARLAAWQERVSGMLPASLLFLMKT
jgi:hypothetical protein